MRTSCLQFSGFSEQRGNVGRVDQSPILPNTMADDRTTFLVQEVSATPVAAALSVTNGAPRPQFVINKATIDDDEDDLELNTGLKDFHHYYNDDAA